MRLRAAAVGLLLATIVSCLGGAATPDSGGATPRAAAAKPAAPPLDPSSSSSSEAASSFSPSSSLPAGLASHPTLQEYRRVASSLPAAFSALEAFEARLKARLAIEEAHEFNERVERGRDWFAPWYSGGGARDPRAAQVDEDDRTRRMLSALAAVEPASLPAALSAEGPPLARFNRFLKAAEAVADLPVPKLLPVIAASPPAAGGSGGGRSGSSGADPRAANDTHLDADDSRIGVCCSLLQYLSSPVTATASSWVPRAGALPPAAVVEANRPDFAAARAAAGTAASSGKPAAASSNATAAAGSGYKKTAKGAATGEASSKAAAAVSAPPSPPNKPPREATPVTAASKRKLTGFLIGPLLAAKSWSERWQRLAVWPLRAAGLALAPLRVAVSASAALLPRSAVAALEARAATAAHGLARVVAAAALRVLPEPQPTLPPPPPSSSSRSSAADGVPQWLAPAVEALAQLPATAAAWGAQASRSLRELAAAASASQYPASVLASAVGLPASPSAALAALSDRGSGVGWALAQVWDAGPWALSFFVPSLTAHRLHVSTGAAALREALARTAALRAALAALPTEAAPLASAAAQAGAPVLDAGSGPCKRVNASVAVDPAAAGAAHLPLAGPLNVTLAAELCPFRLLRLSLRPSSASRFAPLVAHARFSVLTNSSSLGGGKSEEDGAGAKSEEEEEEECEVAADGSGCKPVQRLPPPAASAPAWAAVYVWGEVSGVSEEGSLPPSLRATLLAQFSTLLGLGSGIDFTPSPGATVALPLQAL